MGSRECGSIPCVGYERLTDWGTIISDAFQVSSSFGCLHPLWMLASRLMRLKGSPKGLPCSSYSIVNCAVHLLCAKFAALLLSAILNVLLWATATMNQSVNRAGPG
jgi:hypothetical protein